MFGTKLFSLVIFVTKIILAQNHYINNSAWKSLETQVIPVKQNDFEIDQVDSYNTSSSNQPITYSFPSSYSILVNFGLDGHRRYLYSSISYDCPDNEVWDPFAKECRKLYCNAHSTLIDFKCVETNNTNFSRPTIPMMDFQSKSVQIKINIRLNKVFNVYDWLSQYKKTRPFYTEIPLQLSKALNVKNIERIKNVTIHDKKKFATTKQIQIEFMLNEDNHDISNDKVMKWLADKISKFNNFRFPFYNTTALGSGIHTNITNEIKFCEKDNEMPLWYWNAEFELIENDKETYLHVFVTRRKYWLGQFFSQMFVVRNDKKGFHVKDSNHSNYNVNASTVAVVCETQTLFNDSCPLIMLNKSEFDWSADMKSVLTKNGQIYKKFELIGKNGSVLVCFDENWLLNDHVDLVQAYISTVLTIISLAALFCILITYLIFPSMRSTISGFNRINLVLTLIGMQFTFLSTDQIVGCKFSAIVLHYSILAQISWSSVIAYDMYATFVLKSMVVTKNSWKKKIIYLAMANANPSLIILASLLLENYNIRLAPKYGSFSSACWIRNPLATLVLFGIPLIIHLIINMILYLLTVCNVRVALKSSNILRREVERNCSSSSDQSLTSISSASSKRVPSQFVIFSRIGVLMGFTWIAVLLKASFQIENEILIKILEYSVVICISSQGIILFIAFLCNRKTVELWLNKIKCQS